MNTISTFRPFMYIGNMSHSRETLDKCIDSRSTEKWEFKLKGRNRYLFFKPDN